MPKAIYVQVRGVEKAVRVWADQVEKERSSAGEPANLIFTLNSQKVAEFKDANVDGWWMVDEALPARR